MKTITTILVVLFLFVSIFFGVVLIKKLTQDKIASETTTIITEETTIGEETYSSETGETVVETTAIETSETTLEVSDENIRNIEIYLD